ncbi:uncharacterized protein LOC143448867 [Clavelina lepadiformis]|uniref:uncharacterized protein LOC143448867 n=1 Tax=Clavelina lepadiformis TaxID=159417 RepID=UPI0040436D9F
MSKRFTSKAFLFYFSFTVYQNISAQDNPTYNDCGGTLVKPAESYAVLTNPGYDSKYDNNLHCIWTLESGEKTLLQMKFWDMNIEPGDGGSNTTCEYDYVEVYITTMEESRRFCGFNSPDTVFNGIGTLTVTFHSDDSVNYRGFQATFQVRENFDPCEGDPCQGGGTCEVDTVSLGSKCICVPGLSGENCEIDVDECLSDPCQNGGTCSEGAELDSYICDCPTRWQGHDCEIEKESPCMPNPCMHGGTCEEIDVETAECLCGDGYAGEFCEIKTGCSNPGIPYLDEHRRFNKGTILQFSCIDEYYLHGIENSTCLVNGTWSTELPECYREGTDPGGDEGLSTWSLVMLGLGLAVGIKLIIFVTWMIYKSPWTFFGKASAFTIHDGAQMQRRRASSTRSVQTSSVYSVSDEISSNSKS